MKYLLFLFLMAEAQAALTIRDDHIMPFTNKKYAIKKLIGDYAQMMNLTVSYPADMMKNKETVHVEMNSKSSKAEYKKIFSELLASAGYTAIEDESLIYIYHARDMRYLTTPLYTDETFPTDASFSTVMYKLKYPLASEIARNMRPFMSRYGRIIDLPDNKTILLNDRGDNTERLIKTIKSMDVDGVNL